MSNSCATHFLLLAFGLTACGGSVTRQVVKDRAGKVRAELTRVDGKKDGPVHIYDLHGLLQTTGTYSNDSRHGAWTTVDAQGRTLSIVNFKFGRKHGLQGYWAPNGILLRMERFANGAPDGPLYRFFADGSPRQITWYDHGIPEGPYLEWYKVDSTSIALTMGQFQNGKRTGTWTWFYGNGRIQRQGAYAFGNVVGRWRTWDPLGRERKTVQYGHP